ncbi:hypothetical protein BJX61DRAFT_133560 [Aspergillus egyptiacus]|nr:hypothetical protein BJX61DRAFT_133560 [Aspergillus egyptiacus]
MAPSIDSILSDETLDGSHGVADQIGDIISALKEIRAQLADQNNYLDQLAERYLPKPSPPPFYVADEEWEEEIQPLREAWHDSWAPDSERLDMIRDGALSSLNIWSRAYSLAFATRTTPPRDIAGLDWSAPDEEARAVLGAWPTLPRTRGDGDDERWSDPYCFFASCADRNGGAGGSRWHEQVPAIQMHEMAYDDEGLPELGTSLNNHLNGQLLRYMSDFGEQAGLRVQQWSGQVCGRILRISFEQPSALSLRAMAYILWQLQGFSTPHPQVTMTPILGFAAPWSRTKTLREVDIFGHGALQMALSFQLSWMKVTSVAERPSASSTGLYLHRDHGDIPSVEGDATTSLHLSEIRHSLAMTTTLQLNLPLYTLVFLLDDPSRPPHLTLNLPELSEKLRPHRAGSLMGIGIFLILLSQSFKWVAGRWSETLDQLDNGLDLSLAQMTHEKRQKLMSDDTRFAKSDQCFAVLQALSICREWVRGALRGVKDLCRGIDEKLSAQLGEEIPVADREGLDAIISAVLGDSKRELQPIVERIEKRIREVKRLRDGLCTATVAKQSSLAEDSALQSRYALLFTTIAKTCHLPVGFVMSFFGMHTLDSKNKESLSWAPFMLTRIILSLLIYFTALFAFWGIRDGTSTKQVLTG